MVSSVLQVMRAGGPWSVAALVQGLDELLDTEGRPVGERRASSAAKQDVPMVLRPCPYPDGRQGQPMNVSALAHITRHLDDVLADSAAFAASLPADMDPWDAMGMTIYDALAAPARGVLASRDDEPTVQARDAVAHKLALGFFGLLGRLLPAVANGEPVPANPEGFLAFMHAARALFGQSEVCAGPLPLIARCTDVFMGRVPSTARVDAVRVAVATSLWTQYRVGVAWQLLDETHERWLLRTFDLPVRAPPRTTFLAQRLRLRVADLDNAASPAREGAPLRALPLLLEAGARTRLAGVFQGAAGTAGGERGRRVEEVLAHGDGAVTWLEDADKPVFAARAAGMLDAYRAVVSTQAALETQLRTALRLPTGAPVKFHGTCLPFSWSLEWLQAVMGHRVEVNPSGENVLELCNHRRRVGWHTD